MTTTAPDQDQQAGHRAITLPSARPRGVAKTVVVGWIIAALGIGFALGRLLPAGLLG
ncbi:hypothetical protein [Microlunatus parietis]|uniref:Uncharacterized protein n=1 Tax=Microlunatus parietis TaxID=682979 RepID=A0A7Y9I433_9ACTN|nr:hypothetical protein [Microlunatus parietis]NYE69514.1 hypothetical protein [Microlunatus parietis]